MWKLQQRPVPVYRAGLSNIFDNTMTKLSAVTALLTSLLCAGCMTIIPQSPNASARSGGAAVCETSADGRQVSCGGAAELCGKSPDGQQVACGGRAEYCEKSADGRAVACGGRAQVCERSADGRAVACGGQAQTCLKSADGMAVACGGAR